MTVTPCVRCCDGDASLLFRLPDGEHYNVPLGEEPDTIARLVRGLAQIVAETALKDVTTLVESLKEGKRE